MNNLVKIGLGILLGASLIGNGYLVWERNEQFRVIEVHDGDTFTLKDGQRVKLLGANAPELGLCMSEQATNKLKELVLDKVIKITEGKRDTYGRKMGLVHSNKVLVNEVMIKEGLARPDYTPNTQNEVLKAVYAYAKDNKLGFHSSECKKTTEKPTDSKCVIKGNIDKATGDKFYHLPTCRHYGQIVLDLDLGEGYFCSEKEASSAGFRISPDCLR